MMVSNFEIHSLLHFFVSFIASVSDTFIPARLLHFSEEEEVDFF